MKKLIFTLLFSAVAFSAYAQGGLRPVFPSSIAFRSQLWASWTTNANYYEPLSGYATAADTLPKVANLNITIINVAGTLRNWTIAADTVSAADRDTFILFRSTDNGATWAATSLKITFGGAAKSQPISYDTINSVTVNAGDMLSVWFSKYAVVDWINNAVSCIEFDAKLQ